MSLSRLAFLSALAALAPAAAQAIDKTQVQDLMVQCAACHGADGIARERDVPDLAGQHDVYIYNQLKAFKSGKRKSAPQLPGDLAVPQHLSDPTPP